MPTENTSLKNVAPARDSNTTNKMVIGEINTYQRNFLIVAGSLLALLVLIAVAGQSGGQHLQSSVPEISKGAVALEDYQVDTANSALEMDIFGMSANSGNEKFCGFTSGKCSCGGTCVHTCPYTHGWAITSACPPPTDAGACCTDNGVCVPASIPRRFSNYYCNGHCCENDSCTVGCYF